jgi:hypothetical protein
MPEEKYLGVMDRIHDLSKKCASGEVSKESFEKAVEAEFKKLESRAFYIGISVTILGLLAIFVFIKLFPGAFLVLKY